MFTVCPAGTHFLWMFPFTSHHHYLNIRSNLMSLLGCWWMFPLAWSLFLDHIAPSLIPIPCPAETCWQFHLKLHTHSPFPLVSHHKNHWIPLVEVHRKLSNKQLCTELCTGQIDMGNCILTTHSAWFLNPKLLHPTSNFWLLFGPSSSSAESSVIWHYYTVQQLHIHTAQDTATHCFSKLYSLPRQNLMLARNIDYLNPWHKGQNLITLIL